MPVLYITYCASSHSICNSYYISFCMLRCIWAIMHLSFHMQWYKFPILHSLIPYVMLYIPYSAPPHSIDICCTVTILQHLIPYAMLYIYYSTHLIQHEKYIPYAAKPHSVSYIVHNLFCAPLFCLPCCIFPLSPSLILQFVMFALAPGTVCPCPGTA